MTKIDYQTTLRGLQREQDDLSKEIREVQTHQEDLFLISQQEQRLYAEVVETSEPSDRPYFQDRGEDSFVQVKKAQQQLEEKEHDLQQSKKKLIEKEERTLQEQRKSQLEEKEKRK